MKLTFKNSINEVLSEYDVPNKDVIVESMDTMLINELKVRCEELQRKLADALSKVYDRETRCANAENMRREYEKLVNDNIEQKKMLMSRNSQLENHTITIVKDLDHQITIPLGGEANISQLGLSLTEHQHDHLLTRT